MNKNNITVQTGGGRLPNGCQVVNLTLTIPSNLVTYNNMTYPHLIVSKLDTNDHR